MAEYGTGGLLVACTQLFFSLCSFVVCRRGFGRLARVCTVQITGRVVCGEARSGIANSAFGCTPPPVLLHFPGAGSRPRSGGIPSRTPRNPPCPTVQVSRAYLARVSRKKQLNRNPTRLRGRLTSRQCQKGADFNRPRGGVDSETPHTQN